MKFNIRNLRTHLQTSQLKLTSRLKISSSNCDTASLPFILNLVAWFVRSCQRRKSLVKAIKVSNWKKRQQVKKRVSQFLDLDQEVIIADAISSEPHNAMVNNGPVDREFTVNNKKSISTTYGNTVNDQALERNFIDRTDNKTPNRIGTVEDRIQDVILSAIDQFITPRI